MKLSDYLNRNNLNDAQFGELIGVNRSTVGRWCDEVDPVMPQKAHMERIVKATSGDVAAIDFLNARFDPAPEPLEHAHCDGSSNTDIKTESGRAA